MNSYYQTTSGMIAILLTTPTIEWWSISGAHTSNISTSEYGKAIHNKLFNVIQVDSKLVGVSLTDYHDKIRLHVVYGRCFAKQNPSRLNYNEAGIQ